MLEGRIVRDVVRRARGQPPRIVDDDGLGANGRQQLLHVIRGERPEPALVLGHEIHTG
jgi:hypothetical protein